MESEGSRPPPVRVPHCGPPLSSGAGVFPGSIDGLLLRGLAMEFRPSDSSGTDDDLPPSHQNRFVGGTRVAGNGRTAFVAYDPRLQNDMESQIHWLEQEAYSSVLRAFKAQSDAITWEKESLITELRKELRVTDEEHRDLLGKVNADDIIRRIREWRQGGGLQTGLLSISQPVHDVLSNAAIPTPRRKQNTTQSVPSIISKGGPPSSLHLQHTYGGSVLQQPSPPVPKRRSLVGARGKKPKAGRTSSGLLKYPSTGPSGPSIMANRVASGPLVSREPNEAGASDPLVGRKLYTRWPKDNNFYEAVITDFDVAKGRHVLVYNMNTPNETLEYVNLKEISPDDIRWEGEDLGLSHHTRHAGGGRGTRRIMGQSGVTSGAGRGRGALKPQLRKDDPVTENGTRKRKLDDIEILHTDTLIKELQKVFNASNPDPGEIEKAKRTLKEHEQALVDAIAKLADASDNESEDGEHQFSKKDEGGRNQQFSGGDHFSGYKGDAVAGEVSVRHNQVRDVGENVHNDPQQGANMVR